MRKIIICLIFIIMPQSAFAINAADLHAIQFDTAFYDENDTCSTGTSADSGTAITTPSLEGFVDTYGQQAYDNSIHSGVPYEFTLAQAMLESGYGRSGLTTQANNFFGIKANGSWTGATVSFPTREVYNGSSVTVQALFRKYATPQDSFADHDKFLRENKRYAAAFNYPKDPYQFLVEVFKAGYATDPLYVTAEVGPLIRGVQAYVAKTNKWPPSSAVVYSITDPANAAGTANAGTSNPCGAQAAVAGSVAGYKDPLRDIKNVTRYRIDEGADYGGSGPVYAIGNGTVIISKTTSGWPGGNFISYKLSDGPAAGKVVYFAENCDTKVTTGQAVTADTIICQMNDASPHTETGWGVDSPSTIAAAYGVYHEGDVTAYGINFSDFMVKIGSQPGVNKGGPVVGSLPAGWPTWK
jgi:flagellum-specific peptidoglycan hydrolase FlgJ